MQINDFQAGANMTSRYRDQQGLERLAVAALGLAGEAGEVADMVKKMLGHGHGLDVAALAGELGDVLYYVADAASALGLDLETIAAGNQAKLAARYPDGFDAARSRARYE